MTHTHTPPPTAVSAICSHFHYLPCEYFMVTSVFWTAHAARGALLMRHDAPLSWSPHSRDKSHVFFFLLSVFLSAPFGGFVSSSQLGEGVFKCPEDQLPLDYAKIYPDPELEQQILALPIRCIHSEEGCRWTGQMKQLQSHFSTCAFNVIPCPNRCSVKLTRRDLPEHLQHDCPKRKVKCEFCGSEFTGEAFENHQGICPQESVYCENKCGARMMRRLLSQHTMTECPKRTQPCKYCGKEFVYDTIQNHQYHCPRFPVQCPNQCGTPNIAREDLANHVKESCGSALVLCPFKEAGCKHRCPKMAVGRHLEESTKSHLTMMCNLVGRQRQEIMELRREMEELSVSHDGVLIWKLTDYSRKLQEAKLRNNHEFFSPPFYTHRYGYKLQVSAFLNGNGSGEGSHLSIYIRVLPGEYDNLLEWPFSYKVTFSILDQSDPSLSKPQHITETFNPDPNWKNFQKPCSSRNSLDESTLGFGYPKFISHEEIKKRNYIRDNSIFLKASIEIPQKIMA
ncbi:hypothetical protein QQF64_008401 [Cirrhinus molitorella]|uniref:TNF receptor-associated factor n=1 Tax=Cirrhinus molitorella TaxID=172907 RepID=A0ABR3M930_9TELE